MRNDGWTSIVQAQTSKELSECLTNNNNFDIALINEYIEGVDVLSLMKVLLSESRNKKTVFVLMIYLGKPHFNKKM